MVTSRVGRTDNKADDDERRNSTTVINVQCVCSKSTPSVRSSRARYWSIDPSCRVVATLFRAYRLAGAVAKIGAVRANNARNIRKTVNKSIKPIS